jgi:hypothetical protein
MEPGYYLTRADDPRGHFEPIVIPDDGGDN